MLSLKHVSAAAIAALFALAVTADNADARRGGGGGARGGGGFHGGGGMRGGGFAGGGYRGGGMKVGGYRGGNFGGRPTHPIAGRPGWGGGGNWAGRPGYRPGYGWGGYRPGYGYAVGAAAIGAGLAYGAYGNCYDGYCGGDGYYSEPAYSSDGTSDGVAWCAQRFRTYDVASQTYVGKGGRRISCP